MMKNIVTILMVLVSVVGASQSKHDTIRIGDDINYDLIYDLAIDHLNNLRKDYHAGHNRDVIKNDSLMNYAKFHSKDMYSKEGIFHDNPPAAEVVAQGHILWNEKRTYLDVAHYLIDRFKVSTPHWKILMGSGYKTVGVSFFKDSDPKTGIINDNTMYITINMGYSLDFPKNLVDWENYTVDTNF